jgi:hypothetical protein
MSGGVFDKMVGDCVIGLWGPPFFKETPAERAADALKAAIEIQQFTIEQMSNHPEVSRLQEILKVPGLGVAIGVNLASCPNCDFGAKAQGNIDNDVGSDEFFVSSQFGAIATATACAEALPSEQPGAAINTHNDVNCDT